MKNESAWLLEVSWAVLTGAGCKLRTSWAVLTGAGCDIRTSWALGACDETDWELSDWEFLSGSELVTS